MLTHPPVSSANAQNAAAAVTLLRSAERTGLPDDVLIACLRHPAAAVREQALLIAEPRLARSPDLVAAVLPLVRDADPRVRFQWALTAGEIADRRPVAALAELAVQDAADRWLRGGGAQLDRGLRRVLSE